MESGDLDVQEMVEAIDDPIIISLLPLYLESLKLRCQQLESLVGGYRWKDMARIAHGLRGSSSMYGLDLIANLGKSIEDSAVKAAYGSEQLSKTVEEMNKDLALLGRYAASLERISQSNTGVH